MDEQIEALERIGEALGGDTYFLETVFNPLSVAADLVNDDKMFLDILENHPQPLRDALEVITETFVNFAREALKTGCDGLFFATTEWASRDRLSEEQWAEWGRPYDLRVLAAVKDAPFNVLHVCKNNNMLYALADYP